MSTFVAQQSGNDQNNHPIHGICKQFSDATGWRLLFVPQQEMDSFNSDDHSLNDLKNSWMTEIHDDLSCLGKLVFDLPDNPQLDRSFLAVCDLAELLAKLIGDLTTARRVLDSRDQQVNTLVDIGLSISKEGDIHTAIQHLLSAIVQLTGFRSVAMFLLNGSTTHLTLRGIEQRNEFTIPKRQRLLDNAPVDVQAMSGEKILIRKRQSGEFLDWLPPEASTGLCLPVKSETEPLGTLWAFDRRDRQPTSREIHILESIAAQIATLLERVVLLRESQQQHRLQRDLQLASSSQCHRIDTAVNDSRLDVAGVCYSAHELGGDFSELFPLNDHQTFLVIGDASGDGVSAAMIMSAVRGSLRSLVYDPSYLENPHNTAQMMERINQVLHDITPPHQFMSMLIGVVDMQRSLFTYTNAGHPLPVVLQNNELTEMHSHGMLLGVIDDTDYEQSSVDLHAEGLMVLFTDGISEAMGNSHQMFRSDGVLSAMQQTSGNSAQEVLDSIWNRLENHRSADDKPDDRTLLVLKFNS